MRQKKRKVHFLLSLKVCNEILVLFQKVLNARILYQTKISERRKMTPVAHCNLAARGSLCLKKDLRGASHHVPSGPMPQGRCCDAKNRVPLRSGSS